MRENLSVLNIKDSGQSRIKNYDKLDTGYYDAANLRPY